MAVQNSSTVSSANAAATATISAVAGQKVKVWRVDAFTSTGTSTLTITDGSTVRFRSATGEIGTSRLTITWDRAFEGNPGNAMEISASAAGAGNTVTLNVEADQL